MTLTILFLLIIFINFSAIGEGLPVEIKSDFRHTHISHKTDILLDGSGKLTFADITSGKYNRAFKSHGAPGFNLGMSDNVIWIRFKIDISKNNDDSKELIFAVDNPIFPNVDLHIPLKNNSHKKYMRLKSSYLERSKNYTWRYRYPVFELPKKISYDKYFYLRINPISQRNHVTSSFSLILAEESNFRMTTWFEIAFYCLIFGILISMITYNCFLSFFLKDKAYYLYVVYVIFILLFIILRSGFNIIADIRGLSEYIILSVAMALASGAIFSIYFLSLKKNCPVIYWIICILIGLALIAIVVLFAGYPKFANILVHIISLIGPITAIAAGFKRLYQGFSPARYYLGAWFSLLIAVVCLSMMGLGFLPRNFFTINSVAFASTFEVILLSTALGDRIRVLRKEKRELQSKERRLTELSITDELTGLFNKRWFSSKLKSEIEHSRRMSEPLSLIMIDVDNFKQINDTYGHDTGDKILAELGLLILSSIRDHDIGCRYGGEEFSVILPGTDIDKAYNVAERIRASFESSVYYISSEQSIYSTISIGVAGLNQNDDESELFKKADTALYKAKTEGRNRIVKLV